MDATVLSVNTSPAQAEVLLSVTMGFDQIAHSEAAVADVTLLPGTPNQVTANFVRSDSTATCSGVSGSSELVDLRVAGQHIDVSGQPNQKVIVPGVLTLVINEQIVGTNSITVNALDLTTLAGTQVIVSHAESDITCVSTPPPVSKDFMTGGGFITNPDGSHDNFGFVAGFKPGQTAVSGQFTYIDHSTGLKVKGTVNAYSANDPNNPNSRKFGGPADVDGGGLTGCTSFTVTAADNGEPGKGTDTFGITLSGCTYTAGPATLTGGNIKLHT